MLYREILLGSPLDSAWRFGAYYLSDASLADGVVYFGASDFQSPNGVFAFDAATGALLWSYADDCRGSSHAAIGPVAVVFPLQLAGRSVDRVDFAITGPG